MKIDRMIIASLLSLLLTASCTGCSLPRHAMQQNTIPQSEAASHEKTGTDESTTGVTVPATTAPATTAPATTDTTSVADTQLSDTTQKQAATAEPEAKQKPAATQTAQSTSAAFVPDVDEPATAAATGAKPMLLGKVKYPEGAGFSDFEKRMKIRKENEVTESFASSAQRFSYGLLAHLLSSKGRNVNVSPVSLYYALAVAADGAAGKTAQELYTLLGVHSAQELTDGCGKLYRRLYEDNSITKTKIANSVWIDRLCTVKDSFVQNVAGNLYASTWNVDFTVQKTWDEMADWIRENTNGHIEPRLEPNPNRLITILNTVYFKDQWTDKFQKSLTKPDIFHALAGDVTVDFMHNEFFSAPYAKGEGFTRASLPLKGGAQAVFILPEEGTEIAELTSDAGKVDALLNGGEQKCGKVIWKIPKMDFSYKLNLREVLQSMGVSSAFSQDADFSAMTEDSGAIAEIMQQTHISVNENGVEASAYTEIGYDGAAVPDGVAEMILDRPFVFAITDEEQILFAGVYNNPA